MQFGWEIYAVVGELRIYWPFLIFLALLDCSTPAHAQVAAAISGRVEDVSGGVVSDATVTVKSLETGATRTSVTDASGTFRRFGAFAWDRRN